MLSAGSGYLLSNYKIKGVKDYAATIWPLPLSSCNVTTKLAANCTAQLNARSPTATLLNCGRHGTLFTIWSKPLAMRRPLLRHGNKLSRAIWLIVVLAGRVGLLARNFAPLRHRLYHRVTRPSWNKNLPNGQKQMLHLSFKLMISKLQAILQGDRDPALADDPNLEYDDAVELKLLLEALNSQ